MLSSSERTQTPDGVVVSPAEFRLLRELLEDAQDVRDVRRAEAEYARGEGRPFEDYVRERRGRAAL